MFKNVEKKQGSELGHQNISNIKKHLALVIKKFIHVIFWVFQTNLNK